MPHSTCQIATSPASFSSIWITTDGAFRYLTRCCGMPHCFNDLGCTGTSLFSTSLPSSSWKVQYYSEESSRVYWVRLGDKTRGGHFVSRAPDCTIFLLQHGGGFTRSAYIASTGSSVIGLISRSHKMSIISQNRLYSMINRSLQSLVANWINGHLSALAYAGRPIWCYIQLLENPLGCLQTLKFCSAIYKGRWVQPLLFSLGILISYSLLKRVSCLQWPSRPSLLSSALLLSLKPLPTPGLGALTAMLPRMLYAASSSLFVTISKPICKFNSENSVKYFY